MIPPLLQALCNVTLFLPRIVREVTKTSYMSSSRHVTVVGARVGGGSRQHVRPLWRVFARFRLFAFIFTALLKVRRPRAEKNFPPAART